MVFVGTSGSIYSIGDASYRSSCDRLFSLTGDLSSPDKWIVEVDGVEVARNIFFAHVEEISLEASATRMLGGEVVEFTAFDPAVTTQIVLSTTLAPITRHITKLVVKLDTRQKIVAESGAAASMNVD